MPVQQIDGSSVGRARVKIHLNRCPVLIPFPEEQLSRSLSISLTLPPYPIIKPILFFSSPQGSDVLIVSV